MTIKTECARHVELVSKDRISASNAARDRNSPIRAHQINLLRSSLIGSEYRSIAGASAVLGKCFEVRIDEMRQICNMSDVFVTSQEITRA
jgi:hypothetical protein